MTKLRPSRASPRDRNSVPGGSRVLRDKPRPGCMAQSDRRGCDRHRESQTPQVAWRLPRSHWLLEYPHSTLFAFRAREFVEPQCGAKLQSAAALRPVPGRWPDYSHLAARRSPDAEPFPPPLLVSRWGESRLCRHFQAGVSLTSLRAKADRKHPRPAQARQPGNASRSEASPLQSALRPQTMRLTEWTENLRHKRQRFLRRQRRRCEWFAIVQAKHRWTRRGTVFAESAADCPEHPRDSFR